MSEKLCLQWNDFKENVQTAFSSLRADNDFTDVTLASEDGQQVEAHRVILAASSPLFQNILKRNKHSHPLIYMRGVKSEVLSAILDFLYFGETNIFQEHLDSFLAIADELHLKGLMGANNEETMANDGSTMANNEETMANKGSQEMDGLKKERTFQNEEASVLKTPIRSKSNVEKHKMTHKTFSGTVALTSDHSVDLQGLDVQLDTMMEKTPGKLYRCKVCGKEAQNGDMKRHIEANHLKGVSIPCNHCHYISKSRNGLRHHKTKQHGNMTFVAYPYKPPV